MFFAQLAVAAFRAMKARKEGPSLYEVCDPLLLNHRGGDPHIRKFYRTALRNPALRALLFRAGLPELKDRGRMEAVREAIRRARDDEHPDWEAVGRPVADLLDTVVLSHPRPKPVASPSPVPKLPDIEEVICRTAAHLVGSFDRNGFIPAYAAFNLIGDADFGGRELLFALTGLKSRGYKNSTLLFNLARIFIARSHAGELINPPWTGIAEPMWEPIQIRHRSAYYDAFFIEALLAFLESGLASSSLAAASRRAISEMVDFCLSTSREKVRAYGATAFEVVTALAPQPHPRFNRFFAGIKHDLGFDVYVPDCDTTACAFSAAIQAGSADPMLQQPLLDLYAGYQIREGVNQPKVTLPFNDNINYEGGIVTWMDSFAGERPFGNDIDPTLNLDVLELSLRNLSRWNVLDTPRRLQTLHGIIEFERRLAASGAFAVPRSHIYYLPELYCAYFGRCYAVFMGLPAAAKAAIDPHAAFDLIKSRVLDYVHNELVAHEMNVFDAALALIALGCLGAEPACLARPLHVIISRVGEGGRHGPFKAYEWNKMKTPTRILIGGSEVTSAFVLMGLAFARRRLKEASSVRVA